MRKGTDKHFRNSLLSRQIIYAYAAADGITTALQVGLAWVGLYAGVTNKSEAVSEFVAIYITNLLPVFLPPYSLGDVFVILSNTTLAVLVQAFWSAKFGWSQ